MKCALEVMTEITKIKNEKLKAFRETVNKNTLAFAESIPDKIISRECFHYTFEVFPGKYVKNDIDTYYLFEGFGSTYANQRDNYIKYGAPINLKTLTEILEENCYKVKKEICSENYYANSKGNRLIKEEGLLITVSIDPKCC